MAQPVISGTGVFTPSEKISNEELVESFNTYVDRYNAEHVAEIKDGLIEPLQHSSAEFIEKASGIKSRHVMNREGILDVDRLAPIIPARSNDELSIMAEVSVDAAKKAMAAAGKTAADIDCVIVSGSNMQRAYPAISIEVQNELGIEGFAQDMMVGCASATYGVQVASDYIRAGSAKCVLVISPEMVTGHLNFSDRDSHFIFGDATSALVIEAAETVTSAEAWEIVSTKMISKFSNNIRNNFSFLNRCDTDPEDDPSNLFVQQGRKVFKDVVPLVSGMIKDHLEANNFTVPDVRRMWLHQANVNMNDLIAKKILGRAATADEAPIILDQYGNTSSAGAMIAFHMHSKDLAKGDLGVICAFGAGYAAGSVIIRKL